MAKDCHYLICYLLENQGRKEGKFMAINNSIIGEVYNFYQTSMTSKPSNRFDAHKKAELKNVYNSIVNHSKEEPVFLINRSRDIEQYTISMKESAMNFQQSMASLGGLDGDSLFKQKAVYSSDTNVAEAEYFDDNSSSLEAADLYKLIVNSTAKPQINKGHYLSPDDMRLNPGSYSFDVNIGDSSYELQFSINDTDTNIDIQKRLSRLINNSGIGLNASVSYNDSGMSALSISSTSTGKTIDDNVVFTISDEDTSQQAGAVDYFGIRNISQPASWASYSINDEEFYSADNQINIDNIYTVKLKNPGGSADSPINIGTKPDYESLQDTINGIARSYNNFIKTASEYLEKQPRTTILVDSMKRMANHYNDTFNTLGLTHEDDGTIQVDDKLLADSLTNAADENVIDSMKRFAKSALRKISQVQLNPMDYVDKRIVAYKNPYKTHFANPYITSAYSGMLFNGYM